MKKLILSVMVITSLFFVLSCKQSSDDSTGNGGSGNSGNNNTKILNGDYEYKEVINNVTYTATITISGLRNCDKIFEQGYYAGEGSIKTLETPKAYGAMPYTDEQIEAIILQNFEEDTSDPKSNLYGYTFEQYREYMLNETKGANGTIYDLTCNLNYGNTYDSNLNSFDLNKENIIVLKTSKQMFGENFYYIDKNDTTKLYCLKGYDLNKKFVFTKK